MHCRLLIPKLSGGDELPASLAERRFPSLELLFARGRRSRLDIESREQWLLESFGVARQTDWPSAPYALLGEGRAPGDDYWMHADPAHFSADRDSVLVAEGALLDITNDEAQQIAALVNGHFGDALQLHVAQPGRWYARVASPPPGSTVPLRQATGSAVSTAVGSIQWHALMNEIQMLLHEHPINEARESRGAAVINGVWLWGGGRLAPARQERLRGVLSRHPLAVGLAQCAGVPASPLPADAGAWLARAPEDGVYLGLVEDSGQDPLALLQSLEDRWARPLVEALRRGRIGMATLHFEGRESLFSVEATAGDLRRLWRLRRNIAHYLSP
jgi:hypothetical protein